MSYYAKDPKGDHDFDSNSYNNQSGTFPPFPYLLRPMLPLNNIGRDRELGLAGIESALHKLPENGIEGCRVLSAQLLQRLLGVLALGYPE